MLGSKIINGEADAIRVQPDQGQELMVRRIMPVSNDKFEVMAKRPLNSRLSLDQLQSAFGIRSTDWRAALVRKLKDARG
jgi:dTDP-4-dehydrorhamnose reductase